MQATVVYQAGHTYTLKGRTFRKGIPQVLTNPSEINYLKTQAGFSVALKESEPALQELDEETQARYDKADERRTEFFATSQTPVEVNAAFESKIEELQAQLNDALAKLAAKDIAEEEAPAAWAKADAAATPAPEPSADADFESDDDAEPTVEKQKSQEL